MTNGDMIGTRLLAGSAHNAKKAVLFASFWRQQSHVGNNRVDRFLRWLAESGYYVILIRAGSKNAERTETWGTEITVRDPIGLYRDPAPGATQVSPRKPSPLRRSLALRLFVPDPGILWARAAAKNETVIGAVRGASFILSSSPPESVHLGAWLLSRRTGVPHIVDMRDGWMDEPNNPLLATSPLRRWREASMEARIISDARAIQVTSNVWKQLLSARYEGISHKVHVLTNAYPANAFDAATPDSKGVGERLLIHAGNFLASRSTQSPDLLLGPLLENLSLKPSCGVVQLIGSLSNEDMAIIQSFQPRFEGIGWRIQNAAPIARSKVLARLATADGLLLLAATHAALPSKVFEYIPTGKPLFVVTYKGSATWQLCEPLPQATLFEIGAERTGDSMDGRSPFYEKRPHVVPSEYSEESLARVFAQAITL
jgi:hypothetical protein